MQSTNDIRALFLDYFAKQGHEVVSSSPLVPQNDPTLMFTNAGMVQFKNTFTGQETRDYSRAATSQKCVRAGGKHNDLENVGYTTRHHTFFEMLGNFSFGDYFKDEAIEFAWNLITKEYGLQVDKLLVTVFAEDDQAYDLWQKIAGLSDDKIIRIPTSDNFWSMGDTGPCGPCSEIFYDHGDHIPGGPPGSPDEDGDRFIEIWNLVFMQYEQLSADERIDLPKPSIDTGMGLERISAVLQGTHDNYETDLFKALINASAETSGTPADGDHNVSHRVIADHVRATSFLIADGVLPSNEGRGYVLRRIMRRAMRHAHLMGCEDPLLFKLVPTLVQQMGQAFPELTRAQALITETLELEENRFKRTLDRGLGLLEEETEKLADGGELPGDVAFKLYDTFGFPLDLTQDALRGQGYSVDLDGFNTAMEKQRADARAAWSGSGDAATDQVWFDIHEKTGATEFLGYEVESAEGQVIALVVDGEEVQEAQEGSNVAIILNQTPFYGESGGQEGDQGVISIEGGLTVTITETQKKLGDLHIHIGKVSGGALKVGDEVQLAVDHERRSALRAHHSATHLLHSALRNQLGDHIAQKGSLVAGERLRFDVSHPKAMTLEDLSIVEDQVNIQVRGNSEVSTRLMTPDEAIEAGAMALFGEKYGDEVRVVAMGSAGNEAYSTELCGGTHAHRTGDIGLFRIVSESAVAAGVRRIEAVTGAAAQSYIAGESKALGDAAAVLKVSPADVPGRIEGLLDERRKMEKEITELRRQLATGGGGGGSDADIKEINGTKFLGKILDNVPAKDLKSLADDFKGQLGSGVVALISVNEGKASLVVGVTDDLTGERSAVDLVKAGSAAVGGKGGGGRPDMAQAGGPDGGKAEAALTAIEEAIG
ncbi:MAG: alanine--tRNA ligase [Rhodospirillaceae bacterium]|jgi:alanyl-tRNA synthetase|nr:alanine--tRNA ligase [Rhodospirillaceae bacterium]MBT4938094.1 alanine--tRNA ligase [Rhodospirillaceae bacterium]MBT5940325.1 alanine--tRNA ligase [Rhodospirillaceae bacterium]MBT7269031.1 alanine--tRNA ligase [Rhodospirillaceae bacterium]